MDKQNVYIVPIMWELELELELGSGFGCQSSAKASGGMWTSTSARLGSTLCVTARPLAFTTIHCRSHLNPARHARISGSNY